MSAAHSSGWIVDQWLAGEYEVGAAAAAVAVDQTTTHMEIGP